jgi:DNA-directed DNA polymerase III PolC
MFVHLHVHSQYSLRFGASRVEELLDVAERHGSSAMALTDRDGLYGAIDFYLQARQRGIRPIIGAQLTAPGHRCVCLAADRQGYANLCQIVTARHLQSDFDLTAAVAAHQTGLIVLADNSKTLRALSAELDRDRLYAELCQFDDPRRRAGLRDLYRTAEQLDRPMVAANAVAFHCPERFDIHRALVAIDLQTLQSRIPASRLAHREAYLKSPRQMEALFAGCPQAVENAARIAECCELELEMGRPRFPHCDLPAGETPFSRLCKLAFDGLTRRYRNVTRPAFGRLQHELAIIDQLGFAEYFLIVHDIVEYARGKSIPAVGRGSAADSLVSYCLGISNVDPIEHNLYFERFLNLSRTDCPDIDLDFDWRFRDDVLAYVYQRYGGARVAMIATLCTFQARSAFRDVAKTLGMPPKQIDALTSRLPHYAASTLREAILSFPECRGFPIHDPLVQQVIATAEAIDNYPRHLGVHVGGVVIADRELTWYVPLQRSAKGLVITQYDMTPIEQLGLIKMDVLAQRSLAIVADAARDVQRSHGVELDLDHLPGDDPATAETLAAGRTIGCFQIESPGMRNLLVMLQATNRRDVIHGLSLIRPGPSSSGMKEHYVRRRLGLEQPMYLHPAMKEVLEDSYGVMLYQEDIMQVAQRVAGLTMATGDELRKAMTKQRSPQRMAQLQEAFAAGARANGCDQEVIARLWELISNFAAYSYNKAHACTYGHIAYQATYLKTHWPAEFMAAVLSNIGGYYHRAVYLEEARRLGIPILLPDVNRSDVPYTTEQIGVHHAQAVHAGQRPIPNPQSLTPSPQPPLPATAIRIGLMQVRALAEKHMHAIPAERKRRPFRDVEDLVRRVGLSIEEARNLVLCGACDGFAGTRPELLWRLQLVYHRLSRGRREEPGDLFEDAGDDDRPASRFPRLADYDLHRRIDLELRYLDLAASDSPMARYEHLLAGHHVVRSTDLPQHIGKRVTIAGFLVAARRARTTKDEFMKFISIEDRHGIVEVTLFPAAYRRLGHLLTIDGPYLVRGRVESHHGAVTLNGESLDHLVPEHPPLRPALPHLAAVPQLPPPRG